MSDDSEIVKEFLVESYENLDRLDRDLIALENNPADREILASVFRTIHTIKGTSGFLAFSKLEAVTHVGENLLSRLRDGLLTLNPEITTALLTMVDVVRQMLGSIESAGSEGERNDQELIATLTRLLQAKTEQAPAPVPAPAKEEAPKKDMSQPVPNLGDLLISQGAAKVSDIREAVQQQSEGDPRLLGEILLEKGSVKPQEVLEALNVQQQQGRGQSASDSTIRVDVSLLDQLMNLVGELVLARNQVLQYTNSAEESGLLATSQRLNLITTELQEGVMKTRMQPIGNIWSKFPRTVRDVALGCGKQVRIVMEGKDTELDKTIIEAIKDPLTHLVRNAVDHGIERPEVRQAAGKNPEGCLLLRAFHEGGQVNIEISDDGSGLDHDRIRNKAIQKGLVAADQAARMSDREIANLIFLPGFSTAEKVTNVSGRGVGMDVVKTNIEKIGGTVDVQSKPGQGSTVRMKIPLTLAIIPALIVTSAGDRYAIPQVSLLELVRLEGEQARKGIELVHGAPVYRLRGRLLPLAYLNRELKVEKNFQEQGAPTRNAAPAGDPDECRNVNIVVLQADDRQFGLVVDEINDTEEIVVKPLNKQLKSINVYAGATIMGDGRVALILDVLGLAQCARVVNVTHDHALAEADAKQAATQSNGIRRPVLLFQYGKNGRMAIDLSVVDRLEEFQADAIEIADDREAVQYRGGIMPLIRVSDVLQMKSKADSESEQSVQVVVYADQERRIGLVIDRILDIVEETFVIERQTGRKGVLGSAVIQKRITDVLDVASLIASAKGNFLSASANV
ncbi:MAG: chemotaxis protein CheA [Acidobacteriia bacterium]|nr:chemotaxis protein CheA [Terriglobia bacterium]